MCKQSQIKVISSNIIIICFLGLLSGRVFADTLVYEPFDYPAGSLKGQGGTSEIGLDGAWTAHATDQYLVSGSLSYGALPIAGNSIASPGGSNHFGGARTVSQSALADNGLLADGATLWFSVEMGYNVGGNLTNTRLAFAFGNDQFNGGNFNYWINDDGTQLGSAIGVVLGRFSINGYASNGRIAATQFRDAASGDGYAGNVYGDAYSAGLTGGEHILVVGKILWGVASDTIEIYAPDLDFNLGSPVSTLTVTVDQSAYDTITWARGDAIVMDEIRFGATYDDVIGGPHDPTAPEVDAGADWIAWSGQGVVMDPIVVNNDTTPLTYLWSVNAPAGYTVEFLPNNTDPAPAITIIKDADTGDVDAISITVAVNNESSSRPDVEDVLVIDLYDNSCDAAVIGKGAQLDPADINGDCITGIYDLLEMVLAWLDSYDLETPVVK